MNNGQGTTPETTTKTTTNELDYVRLWQVVKENQAKLRSCPIHKFDTSSISAKDLRTKMSLRLRCERCGGEMLLIDIRNYALGYRAGGRNGNEVLPGYFD